MLPNVILHITYCAAVINAERTLNLQKALYTLPPVASYEVSLWWVFLEKLAMVNNNHTLYRNDTYIYLQMTASHHIIYWLLNV